MWIQLRGEPFDVILVATDTRISLWELIMDRDRNSLDSSLSTSVRKCSTEKNSELAHFLQGRNDSIKAVTQIHDFNAEYLLPGEKHHIGGNFFVFTTYGRLIRLILVRDTAPALPSERWVLVPIYHCCLFETDAPPFDAVSTMDSLIVIAMRGKVHAFYDECVKKPACIDINAKGIVEIPLLSPASIEIIDSNLKTFHYRPITHIHINRNPHVHDLNVIEEYAKLSVLTTSMDGQLLQWEIKTFPSPSEERNVISALVSCLGVHPHVATAGIAFNCISCDNCYLLQIRSSIISGQNHFIREVQLLRKLLKSHISLTISDNPYLPNSWCFDKNIIMKCLLNIIFSKRDGFFCCLSPLPISLLRGCLFQKSTQAHAQAQTIVPKSADDTSSDSGDEVTGPSKPRPNMKRIIKESNDHVKNIKKRDQNKKSDGDKSTSLIISPFQNDIARINLLLETFIRSAVMTSHCLSEVNDRVKMHKDVNGDFRNNAIYQAFLKCSLFNVATMDSGTKHLSSLLHLLVFPIGKLLN